MNTATVGILFAWVLLQGCALRSVALHDGVSTTVIDAVTKKPIANAFAYARLRAVQQPHVLAFSNAQGELRLAPQSRLTFTPLLGEAMVGRHLWVCKEGYAPFAVASGHGWNLDYRPTQTYTPDLVELSPSALAPADSCLALRYH